MNLDGRILTILIPTYNRSSFLIKNLNCLSSYIRKLSFLNKVSILVSDNASKDNTAEAIKSFVNKNSDVNIDFFLREKNVGLQANALFVLEKASTPFVMYMGDDDYIAENYLKDVVRTLETDCDVSAIVPSFQCVSLDGVILEGIARDLNVCNRKYVSSFYSCLENSWRGHQLSGLVFRRKGLLQEYVLRKVNNIYPFIFFVAYSSLHGNLYHITNNPVLVTRPGQDKKDWGYGRDGLVGEIFDNYKKLFRQNILHRFQLEMKLLDVQEWRYKAYLKKGGGNYLWAIMSIIISRNTSFLTKLAFPGRLFLALLKETLFKLRKFFRK